MRAKDTKLQRIPKSLDDLLRDIQKEYKLGSIPEAGRFLVIQYKNGKKLIWGRDYL